MEVFTVEYTNETSGWEEWQFEYRFGAFYIFPPTGVMEAVDALRETYDPQSAAICRAHISLSEPLQAPLSEEKIQEIRRALSAVQPFEIQYGPLRSFPPHPGVCYSIAPEAAFRRLRRALHATSVFAAIPLKRESVAPHMTIAEFISLERTDELLQELSGKVAEGIFPCDSIVYAVPNSDFYFERVLEIPLGG
ncbi:MAG: 2'-5' RNA ligase family protein [Chloroflexi bacterium]|nr:MAG: 2'-5' RNA ligase family protein [Chloroflexota bacterium]